VRLLAGDITPASVDAVVNAFKTVVAAGHGVAKPDQESWSGIRDGRP
jgi:O-acetyl-ADP-ribose deacetylase (regulator of RNase III)